MRICIVCTLERALAGSGGGGGGGDGGNGGGGGGNDFDAAVARAIAAALGAGARAPPPGPVHGSPMRTARAAQMPDTRRQQWSGVLMLKRQIKGLKAAAMVGGVDAMQRRADAIMLVDLEDDLTRREVKRVRYGR